LTTKVNGEEMTLDLNPQEAADYVRQGKTFFQNQEALKVRENELAQREAQLAQFDPAVLVQVQELQKLKAQDPNRFNEVQYSLNKQIVGQPAEPAGPSPEETKMSEMIGDMKKMAEAKPELEILGKMATLFELQSDRSKSEVTALRQELSKVTGSTQQIQQNLTQREQATQAASRQSEMNKIGTFLTGKGVSKEQILAKATEFNALYNSGIPSQRAAEIVYATELNTQPQAPATPPAPAPYTPVRPGSALPGGGSSAPDPTAALEKELFGEPVPIPK